MNSQKQGSDADMESVDVSTVSHSFRLEWKIPSETILDNKHVPRKLSTLPQQPSSTSYDALLNAGLSFETNTTPTTVVENSKWFEFKDLKIPPFYLELSCEKCYDDGGEMPHCRVKVVTKDHRGDIMKLNYALVARGDRLYRLMAGGILLGNNDKKEQEATLDVLRGICREQKCLTVVCQVTVESDVRISSSASSDQCANDIEKMSLECAFPSRSFHTTSSSSSSVEEAIDKYLTSGALPSLDVGLARELLLTAPKGQAELLRALSAEFLVRNLDDGNVAGVWGFAIEHRVQSLIVECGRYMAKHWKAASSSDSGEKAMEQHKQKNFLFSNVYCK